MIKTLEGSKIIKVQWVIIAVFFILISFLIYQNIQLKFFSSQANKKRAPINKAQVFEDRLKEIFLFKKFPIPLNIDEFYFLENIQKNYVNSYLIMVFDLTVCGKCLHEQLDAMKLLKEKIEDKNISILAIAGISAKTEEAEIIGLHKIGKISFPCKTVPVDMIYSTFNLNREVFVDTPFYFYTTHQFQVLDIFKPNYMEIKEFVKWLNILASQNIF